MSAQNSKPGPLHADAGALAEVVAYQDGAVVSREIMKGRAGTVTVFAFDAGQGLSEHTVSFDALVHVLDGEAEITIAGQAHTVSAGQAIIMPAGQPHAVNAAMRFKMLLVLIKE